MRAAATLLLLCLFNALYGNAYQPFKAPSRTSVAGFGSRPKHWQRQQQQHQREQAAVVTKQCASGCEKNGNCNRALGICECPVGYAGPTCSEPLWPSCRVAPEQLETYCTNDWVPKSCACLQQCAAFVCPDGTHASCERDFDLFNSKCFLRSSNVSTAAAPPPPPPAADGVFWDGGSDLPEDTDEGVRFYMGWLHKETTREITRQEVAASPSQNVSSICSWMTLS
jgi:hypothetical protein